MKQPNYNETARNAIHAWVERTYVVPFLEGDYLDKLDDPEQYPINTKNADRKLSFILAPRVTIERKHDRAHDKPNLPVELLGNQPLNTWWNGRIEPFNGDGTHRNLTHQAYVPRVMAYADACPDNEHGLITANLKGFGSHYLQYIKAYPTGKEGEDSYEKPYAEAWLFESRTLQSEVRAQVHDLPIGGTNSERRGETWRVIMSYIQPVSKFPNLHNEQYQINVSKSVVLGPIDITDAYARLWRLP